MLQPQDVGLLRADGGEQLRARPTETPSPPGSAAWVLFPDGPGRSSPGLLLPLRDSRVPMCLFALLFELFSSAGEALSCWPCWPLGRGGSVSWQGSDSPGPTLSLPAHVLYTRAASTTLTSWGSAVVGRRGHARRRGLWGVDSRTVS